MDQKTLIKITTKKSGVNLDNASNNSSLTKNYTQINLSYENRNQFRFSPHVVNLAVKSFLSQIKDNNFALEI
ncbi:hypothetical protein AYI68_g4669 [Smittium mucronatum]|uniref:Uncharacterized protein n=1 Tax=Smittium mucronatum TaxID=133383 RepID=A0A1R0GWK6_9FUNG|nr:hypothetical protein AYI68_g4669 [Smittium mucronatum]